MNWVLLVVYFTTTGWHVEIEPFNTYGGCLKAERFISNNFPQAKYVKAKCIIDGGKTENE